MARPYGVSLLVAGVSQEDGPTLWQVDPSGTFVEWQANAIGGASEGALNILKKEYFSTINLKEAEILALKTLKNVMEKTNVQLFVARMDNLRFEKRSVEHIEEILAIAEEQFQKEEQAQMNI